MIDAMLLISKHSNQIDAQLGFTQLITSFMQLQYNIEFFSLFY